MRVEMIGGPNDGQHAVVHEGETTVYGWDSQSRDYVYEYTLAEDGRLHFATRHVAAEFDHETFEQYFLAYTGGAR